MMKPLTVGDLFVTLGNFLKDNRDAAKWKVILHSDEEGNQMHGLLEIQLGDKTCHEVHLVPHQGVSSCLMEDEAAAAI